MKVFLNDQEVVLFQGAKVKHLLLKGKEDFYHLARRGLVKVVDQEGNEVDLLGTVAEGWGYYIKEGRD